MRSISVSMIRLINELYIHVVHDKNSAGNEYCADSVVDSSIVDKISNKQTSVLNYSTGNSKHKLL